MNQRQADALIDAGLKGVRQLKNQTFDGRGGYCAMGVIILLAHLNTANLNNAHVDRCPECGATAHTNGGRPSVPLRNESDLIVHLNNDHGWDFISIARKLAPEEAA